MGLLSAQYDVHGVRLNVCGQEPSLLSPLAFLLGAYATPHGSADAFQIELDYGRPEAPSAPTLPQFWAGTLPDGSRLICRHGPGRRQFEVPNGLWADIDLAQRTARILVVPGSEGVLMQACVPSLLCECLGQAGFQVIHAASLFTEIDGCRRAILISGVSGTGKTTLALALARAGLGLLADDMTFYHPGPVAEPGEVWGIRTHCKVSAPTLELLPWLKSLPTPGATVTGERLVDCRSLAPQTTRLTARPELILFLNPRNSVAHRIEPLDKLTALARLTRDNIRAFETDREATAGRGFEALGKLVRSTCTFQASLCPRLEELPCQLASLWSGCS